MFAKLFIGCDHTGNELKDKIKEFIKSYSIPFEDVPSGEDYVDVAKSVATLVANSKDSFGILICGSGVGVSVASNRVSGVRSALCHSVEVARLSRLHNDANVLCLGARLLKKEEQIEILKTFLNTEFEGERHLVRIAKIDR
jgi:ribose 5-phosphate isomerase B